MGIRELIEEILMRVREHPCTDGEKELVRMLFERVCVPDSDTHDPDCDDFDY